MYWVPRTKAEMEKGYNKSLRKLVFQEYFYLYFVLSCQLRIGRSCRQQWQFFCKQILQFGDIFDKYYFISFCVDNIFEARQAHFIDKNEQKWSSLKKSLHRNIAFVEKVPLCRHSLTNNSYF